MAKQSAVFINWFQLSIFEEFSQQFSQWWFIKNFCLKAKLLFFHFSSPFQTTFGAFFVMILAMYFLSILRRFFPMRSYFLQFKKSIFVSLCSIFLKVPERIQINLNFCLLVKNVRNAWLWSSFEFKLKKVYA